MDKVLYGELIEYCNALKDNEDLITKRDILKILVWIYIGFGAVTAFFFVIVNPIIILGIIAVCVFSAITSWTYLRETNNEIDKNFEKHIDIAKLVNSTDYKYVTFVKDLYCQGIISEIKPDVNYSIEYHKQEIQKKRNNSFSYLVLDNTDHEYIDEDEVLQLETEKKSE